MAQNELILKKTKAYSVYASNDDKGFGSIIGYYQDYNIASVKSKGVGFYGADGEVESVEVWQDENGNIYSLKPLGKYTDVAEKYKDETLQSIKSKLTKEELELLGIHSK